MKKWLLIILVFSYTKSSLSQKIGSPAKNSFEVALQPFYSFTSSYFLYGGRPAVLGVNKWHGFTPLPFVSVNYYRNINYVSVGSQADIFIIPSYNFLSANVKINLPNKTDVITPIFQLGIRNVTSPNPFVGAGIRFATAKRFVVRLGYYHSFIPDEKKDGYVFKEQNILFGVGLKLGKQNQPNIDQ